MCVIFVGETALPKYSDLRLGEEHNSHGGGMAWVSGGKVRFKKGLSARQMCDLVDVLEVTPPAVFHFRWATVGGRTRRMTHPFPIAANAADVKEGSASAVLFHNGTWDGWAGELRRSLVGGNRRLPDGDWSDSRAMAYLTFYHGMGWLRLLLEEESHRIAVLTPEKIHRYGEWDFVEAGVWASNMYWWSAHLGRSSAAVTVNPNGSKTYHYGPTAPVNTKVVPVAQAFPTMAKKGGHTFPGDRTSTDPRARSDFFMADSEVEDFQLYMRESGLGDEGFDVREMDAAGVRAIFYSTDFADWRIEHAIKGISGVESPSTSTSTAAVSESVRPVESVSTDPTGTS